VRAYAVVVAPPAFDHDLGFTQRVKDLALQQFVAQATSVTPIARIASATVCPCDTRTSTCRSLATASSGRCFLLAISVLLRFEPIPRGGPLRRGRISAAL
jgi:hypothetical protein